MPERRVEFDPIPAEPDKYETPAAKNKRLREQQESWEEVGLDDKDQEKKAA